MTINSLVNFGVPGKTKETTADDIRKIQNEAVARQQSEDRAKAIREHQAKESKRLAVMSHSQELFAPVLEKMTEAASRGNSSYRHQYNGEYEQSVWEAAAIAAEARARAFIVEYKREDSDMGDSAAPCWTTFHWLNISW